MWDLNTIIRMNAEAVQKVEAKCHGEANVSPRYGRMRQVARNYLETLETAKGSPAEKLEAYSQRLASSIAPYADNPAFQAFLEMKRCAKFGG